MNLIDSDDMPIFTYVSDCRGACVECTHTFREGDTVVRVGVTCASWVVNTVSDTWKRYHLECWNMISHKVIQ